MRRSECDVGGRYGGDSGPIAGSGGSKVGDGVDGSFLVELCCILFLQVIGGVEFGTGSGAMRFALLVVRTGKEIFETGPSLC